METSDNVFEYFNESFEIIFKIAPKDIQCLLNIYNNNIDYEITKKFAQIIKVEDIIDADHHQFALGAIAEDYHRNNNQTLDRLNQSNIPSPIKKKIKNFLLNLNKNGLHNLRIQHHIAGTLLLDFTTVENISKNKMLVEITDYNDTPLCYVAMTKIKIAFSNDTEKKTITALFSQTSLYNLISLLQKIYDENSELIRCNNNSINNLPVIKSV